MSSNSPQLEVWLNDIQAYLHKTVGRIIEAEDFKFNRYDFSFKRKQGKNFQEFCFLFLNQVPVNYRATFFIKTWHHEIKSLKEDFPQKDLIENFNSRSVIVFMSDLVEPPVTPAPHDFVISTEASMFDAVEAMIKIVHEQAFPLCNRLSTLDGLDGFFATRKNWSVNSLSLNNIASDLMAAKLNGRRNFDEVYQHIRAAVVQKIENKEMYPSALDAVDALYTYTKGHIRKSVIFKKIPFLSLGH